MTNAFLEKMIEFSIKAIVYLALLCLGMVPLFAVGFTVATVTDSVLATQVSLVVVAVLWAMFMSIVED